MFRIILFCYFFLTASITWAQSNCDVGNFKAFVLCVSKEHPDFKKHELSFSQGEGIESAGSAFQNPEVDLETTQGRSLGEKAGSNRIMVSYPLQLFGQRAARKDKASAESALLRIEGLKGQNGLIAETTVNLYRLRQIKEEIAILDETLSAYSRVINQFASRRQLSPEQEVTLSVFRLAVGDLNFKKAGLESEQRKILDFFSYIPSLTKSQIEKNLPAQKQNWPNIASKKIEFNGWPIKEVESKLKLAQAEFDESRAETWPEVKAGFIFQQEIQGSFTSDRYGVGVTLPIPLLNWNQGNRQAKSAVYQKAKIEKERAYKEVTNERVRLIELYKAALENFKKAPKEDEITRQHNNIESKYSRGLINSALMIEAHRQRFEYKTSQNGIELNALQALFRVYEMDGSSFEELL